jgi:hypothetical protein
MQNQLFEAAFGIANPWYVGGVDFEAARKVLTIGLDFVAGSRFAAPGIEGLHRVHDTQTKRLRHLNFFQHECHLEGQLPDGRVVQIEPDWFGKLSGFTLLFEALVLAMAQQMTFAAVARLVYESWHRVHAICSRYVDLALAEADLSKVAAVAINETACRRGHDYLTIAADAAERKVVFVTEGRDARTIARFVEHLAAHKAQPEQIATVTIDMSPAFIRGVADHLPKARITFDKFHVVAHASAAPITPDALSSGPIPASKACAGPCSRIARGCLLKPAPTSMPWSARPPPNAPPAPGSTAKDCAPSSIASRSTSLPPCSSSGAPMSCAPRWRR